MNFDIIRKFQDSLKDRGIAGNDLAIYVDFKPVYRYFSGWQNIEEKIPVNAHTMFKMFSMSKPITCAAALKLFEEGKFLLNEPVADYLPSFGGKAEKEIAIQDLFMMGAGLDYDLEMPSIRALREKTGGNYTTREFADAIAEKPLDFVPGTHWQYSLAHDVIGALIEVWSGMTFGEYLKKNFFEPLHMDTAAFHVSPELEKDYCIRYGLDPETGEFVRGDQVNPYQRSLLQESGGAGLSMTVDDYAKFACMMTNRGVSADGTRILAGRTVDLMRRNFLNEAQYRDLFASSPAREGYGYGLGVRTLMDPAASGSLSPVGEFGWGGAWGTYTLFDPENKVTIVYGEQAVDTQGHYIQRRIRNMTYAALEWEGMI